MNVLSLFTGIGGLDLGLERAGFRTVGQVELDPFCRKVLDKHWPEVPKHDDVRTAPAWWLGEPRPAVDVVAGGPPCQGHSVAGKQRGTADERWGWPWFRGVVEAVEPPYLLIENVPNLTRTGLVDILRDLADLGFDAWWGRVPAAAVGAPHLRWRLFVIAAHAERVKLRDEPGWCCGADGEGQTVTGHDGATWALADPKRLGGELRTAQAERSRGPSSGSNSIALADTGRAGLPQRPVQIARSDTHGHGQGHAVTGREGGAHRARLGDWPAEPDVGRVAHGVPGRVDRLKSLGNAVVPAVGEYVGHLLRDLIEQQRGSARDAA